MRRLWRRPTKVIDRTDYDTVVPKRQRRLQELLISGWNDPTEQLPALQPRLAPLIPPAARWRTRNNWRVSRPSPQHTPLDWWAC